MALLGADTEELRGAAQKCQEGKETTDQVITFVRALIALLRAASFFTGGASAAYATFLETQVLPWLQKISMALGLFGQVLGANADAQDQVSAGETVDLGKLPTYTSPLAPSQSAPMTRWDGGSIAPGAAMPGTPGTTTTTTTTTTSTTGPDGVTVPGATTTTTTTTTAPALGSPVGLGALPGAASGAGGATTAAPAIGGAGAIGGALPGAASGNGAGSPFARPEIGGLPAVGGGGSAGGSLTPSGSGGGSGAGSGGAPAGLGGASIDGGLGRDIAAGSPLSSTTEVTPGGGGTVPGAEGLGSAALNPTGESVSGASERPSYGAAAGLAGGAAALGLGGAALAARGGQGNADGAIEKLVGENGRGSRGEGVRELQERLTAAGYDTRGADGQWGGNTQAAYEAWRADNPIQVPQGNGFSSPTGYDYQQIQGVAGNRNVTPEFLREVEGVAARVGAKPEHLLATMSFETGGRFSSDVVNARSGATGLIQFMPKTAEGLGTSTEALSRMTPTEQLQYVERYFEPHRGRLDSLENVYTSVLGGRPMAPESTMFTEGTKAYHQNRELDVNGDGRITAAEATSHVRSRMRD